MNRIWNYLRLFRALHKLNKNEKATDFVFDVSDAIFELGAYKLVEEKVKSNSEIQAMVKSRQLFKYADFEKLSKLPQDSLGKMYFDHMKSLNLSPDFYRVRPIENDCTYVMMRLRETHDIWHVVTGFNTEVEGEIALQSFMIAQIGTPLSVVLVAGSIIKALFKRPEQLPKLMEKICAGYNMGLKSKPIFAVSWENMWSTPLTEVRENLLIQL